MDVRVNTSLNIATQESACFIKPAHIGTIFTWANFWILYKQVPENDVHLLIFSPHPFNQQRKFSWYFNDNDEPSREAVQPVSLNPTWTTRFFMCSFVNSGKRIMVGGYSENPETGAKLDRSQVQVRETYMVQLEDLGK